MDGHARANLGLERLLFWEIGSSKTIPRLVWCPDFSKLELTMAISSHRSQVVRSGFWRFPKGQKGWESKLAIDLSLYLVFVFPNRKSMCSFLTEYCPVVSSLLVILNLSLLFCFDSVYYLSSHALIPPEQPCVSFLLYL